MRIQEIFTGVSGECGMFRQGSWCTFIRLAGCNLRCKWCDTIKAQKRDSGKEMEISEVVDEIKRKGNNQILLTGGEPLLQQKEVIQLIDSFNYEYQFQIETNGSIFSNDLWHRVPAGRVCLVLL